MKCAVMQPYFLPYLGYFQLIAAVDKFVIFDDVNFIKKGWINRNSILLNHQRYQFTLPVADVSQNRQIQDHSLATETNNREKLLSLIRQAYAKAPQFKQVMPLIENIVQYPDERLNVYLTYGITQISRFLGLSTEFILSSSIGKDPNLKGQNKILAIARALGATDYINAIGGLALYDQQFFAEQGIELFFIKTNIGIQYPQYDKSNFVPNLSIVDVMMFNDRLKLTTELLHNYELVQSG